MSGLFGVVDPQRRVDSDALTRQMAACLTHRPWYQVDRHLDPAANSAVGRTGIGIFNPRAQPVWNGDRTRAAFLTGEFYGLAGQTAARPHDTDEAWLLALYEQYGLEFARHLDGAFVCAIWDGPQQRLVIANDRFGLYPLYYATQNQRLIFAPEVKALVCDRGLRKQLDHTALAQYMRFQHLLGVRTFFDDVRLLAPASRLVCDLTTAACRLDSYWSFADIPERPGVGFEEATEEVGRLLRQAVRRCSEDHYRPGVYLSGGLDSRLILGLIERRPVTSITYGARHSRDVFYAAQIARAAGSDHHWFDLGDGRWVLEHVDLHLALTEGFHSWIHAHGMSTLAAARPRMDLNLSGWDGGTVMGDTDTIEPLQLQPVDDQALTTYLFGQYNQHYTWPGLTEAEERLLYTPAMWARVRGLAFESFQEELRPYLALRPDVRSGYFYIRNHCGRLTHNMMAMYRSHMEVRFPFFDYAVFDFLYSLPAVIRRDKALYRAVLQRETPRLAGIPYDHDEFMPTSRRWLREAHALTVKVRRRAGRWLKLGAPAPATLYADYEAYLRGELRAWAEGLLYDPRVAERDLFDPGFVRTLMARHLSGLEQWTIGRIAPVMTYEMMLRQLYDGGPPAAQGAGS